MNHSRKSNIDFLRILAALSVVIFHVLCSSANSDPEVPRRLYDAVIAFSAALQWHVAVFFMITGYLWLSDEKECTFEKMVPNIRRFLLVLATFGFGYAILERLFGVRSVSIALLTASLQDVLTGQLWDHMWFVYAIIGIYLVLPVLKPFFYDCSLRAIATLTGLLFVFTIVSPVVKNGLGYSVPIAFPIQEHMFYVCAGGMIAKWKPTQHKTAGASALIFLFSMSTAFWVQLHAVQYDFCIPLLSCISAVHLFIAITIFTNDVSEILWIRNISNCTFGIYLLHPLFINIMIKLLHIYPLRWQPFVSIIGVSALVAGLSYMFTYLLRKIWWIKRYIL